MSPAGRRDGGRYAVPVMFVVDERLADPQAGRRGWKGRRDGGHQRDDSRRHGRTQRCSFSHIRRPHCLCDASASMRMVPAATGCDQRAVPRGDVGLLATPGDVETGVAASPSVTSFLHPSLG